MGTRKGSKFRKLAWKCNGNTYFLQQVTRDSQVWMAKGEATETIRGLVLVYVDDLLLLTEAGAIREELKAALRRTWTIGSETELTKGVTITFIGLELEVEPDGTLRIHQSSFTRSLLAKHGMDGMTKPVATVQAEHPTGEREPTAVELKQLQQFAGEFNWLATRTRPDISYFTSLLASSLTKYPDWSLMLAKRIVRYLLGTPEQGLRYPQGGPEDELIAWSDAGFAGASTKSQSGSALAWAGAIIQWRSSKQHNSALSTCEAEVAAAAATWQVTEGLLCLLQEWQAKVVTPVLLVDNKSAIVVCDSGGSWRTRYFAVRAARISEEVRGERLSLRYCRTDAMVADTLTKLVSALLLEKFRAAMDGKFPEIPGKESDVHVVDKTWWSALVLDYRLPRAARKGPPAENPVVVASVSPGPANRGDATGDGPAETLREDQIWLRVMAIWIKNDSPQLERFGALREHYTQHGMSERFSEGVCEKYGEYPELTQQPTEEGGELAARTRPFGLFLHRSGRPSTGGPAPSSLPPASAAPPAKGDPEQPAVVTPGKRKRNNTIEKRRKARAIAALAAEASGDAPEAAPASG